jgi:hypothetical protein
MAEPWFDAVTWARVTVLAGLGGGLDPGSAVLHLGVGPGLGTARLGGATWVDLGGTNGTNVRSITPGVIQGQDGPVDSPNPATLSIVLNNKGGEYDPDNSSSPYFGMDVGTPIKVRAEMPVGTFWTRFTGEITDIDLDAGFDPIVTIQVADPLEKLGRTQLREVSPPIGDGERSSTRVSRILDAAGYPSTLRSIETGYTTVAPTVYGESALELLRKVALTEFGTLFCDGDGNVVFWNRHHQATASRSVNVQAVISDTDTAGQGNMLELALTWSRDRTWNDVHVLRDPIPAQEVGFEDQEQYADESVEQVATDPNPDPAWGTLSMPGTVGQLLVSDEQSLGLAGYLLARFNVSQPRVRRVQVNLLRKNLWSTFLPLRIGDRIQVVRNYGPRTITEELLVQGKSEAIVSDPPDWTLSLELAAAPAAPSLFVLGTAQIGSSSTGKLGW